MTTTPPGEKPAVVLVVEDDRSLREGLAMNLRMQGYEVRTAADAGEGLGEALETNPALVVLDLMLPGGSGLDLLEALRERGRRVPVLILSARGTTADKVAGLGLGADDYMTKPFDLPELIARVEALLRRQRDIERNLPELVAGDLAVDRVTRTARVRGRALDLSAREFDLLALFAASPGQVFTRDAILQRVWGWDYEGTARTVDNFVANLRRKLDEAGGDADRLDTVPRVGYRLRAS